MNNEMLAVADVVTGGPYIVLGNVSLRVGDPQYCRGWPQHQVAVVHPVTQIEPIRITPVIARDVQQELVDRSYRGDDVFLGGAGQIGGVDDRLVLRGLTLPVQRDPGGGEEQHDHGQSERREFPGAGSHRNGPVHRGRWRHGWVLHQEMGAILPAGAPDPNPGRRRLNRGGKAGSRFCPSIDTEYQPNEPMTDDLSTPSSPGSSRGPIAAHFPDFVLVLAAGTRPGMTVRQQRRGQKFRLPILLDRSQVRPVRTIGDWPPL